MEYRISRYDLARLATEEYLRSFWWFVMIVPSFGLVALVFGQGILQIVGYLALLWPFTIPARAILSTNKASRLFRNGTKLTTSDSAMFFHSPDGKGLKLDLDSVRGVVERREYTLVQFRSWNPVPLPAFVPIPNAAFASKDNHDAFLKGLRTRIAERFVSTESP